MQIEHTETTTSAYGDRQQTSVVRDEFGIWLQWFRQHLNNSTAEERQAFLREHPELAGLMPTGE